MKALVKYDDDTIGVVEVKEVFFDNGLNVTDYDGETMIFNEINLELANLLIKEFYFNGKGDLTRYGTFEWAEYMD